MQRRPETHFVLAQFPQKHLVGARSRDHAPPPLPAHAIEAAEGEVSFRRLLAPGELDETRHRAASPDPGQDLGGALLQPLALLAGHERLEAWKRRLTEGRERIARRLLQARVAHQRQHRVRSSGAGLRAAARNAASRTSDPGDRAGAEALAKSRYFQHERARAASTSCAGSPLSIRRSTRSRFQRSGARLAIDEGIEGIRRRRGCRSFDSGGWRKRTVRGRARACRRQRRGADPVRSSRSVPRADRRSAMGRVHRRHRGTHVQAGDGWERQFRMARSICGCRASLESRRASRTCASSSPGAPRREPCARPGCGANRPPCEAPSSGGQGFPERAHVIRGGARAGADQMAASTAPSRRSQPSRHPVCTGKRAAARPRRVGHPLDEGVAGRLDLSASRSSDGHKVDLGRRRATV